MNKEDSIEIEKIIKKTEYLGKKDIFEIPGIKNNPISTIIIKRYMKRGKMDFPNLITAMYKFTHTRNLDEKLKCIFEIYDIDQDGYISNKELFDFLKLLNRGIIEDWKLQNIVDQTFAEIGDYTIKMNYLQFKELICKRVENINELFDCEN